MPEMICLSVALAVYMRSPAALKRFGIIQLPSKSTLQSYTGAFMHNPGARKQCIASQVAHYVLFKEQCREFGKQEPKSDGVLIFDEVKIACQLMWNSHSHQLMGLAMTHCLHWMTFTECWRSPRVPNKLVIYFSFSGATWPANLILLGHFSLQHLLWTANLSQHVFWRPSNFFSFIDSKQV